MSQVEVKAEVKGFFDLATNTISYVVTDPSSKKCAIIDSLLDFDPASGRTETKSAQLLVDYVRKNNLECQWIIDTHVHADHLTAAPYVQQKIGGKTAIGDKISLVQTVFKTIFNENQSFHTDGSQFNHLFADGETYMIGNLQGKAIHTPGHTPACMSHLIGDALFVGDTLFMPDYGTARCDFPGGDSGTLYDSIQKLYKLPNTTRMFLCHDYLPKNRKDYHWQTSIEEQKQTNIHVTSDTIRDDFILMRDKRDSTLEMPKLILPSVQINMRAGQMPPAEENGMHYIKIPINAL